MHRIGTTREGGTDRQLHMMNSTIEDQQPPPIPTTTEDTSRQWKSRSSAHAQHHHERLTIWQQSRRPTAHAQTRGSPQQFIESSLFGSPHPSPSGPPPSPSQGSGRSWRREWPEGAPAAGAASPAVYSTLVKETDFNRPALEHSSAAAILPGHRVQPPQPIGGARTRRGGQWA